MMSDLTINSTTASPIGAGNSSATPATPPQANKPAPQASSTPSPSDLADSVSLSGVGQNSDASTKPPLSESDAQSQAMRLRQQLNGVNLSGTARQNQAIVSLLRS
jgi:hypothetical protein